MQINFKPEKIKAAKAYVDRLTPAKVEKNKKLIQTKQERNPSFFKSILNFLFK